MIILIIGILSAVIYLALNLFMKPSKWRIWFGWIAMVICALSLILSMLNWNEHLGMVQVDQIQNTQLVPLNNKNKIAISREKIKYRTKKGVIKTKINKHAIKIVEDSKDAYMITTTATWEFKNSFLEFLFKMPNYNYTRIIKQEFYLPEDWAIKK